MLGYGAGAGIYGAPYYHATDPRGTLIPSPAQQQVPAQQQAPLPPSNGVGGAQLQPIALQPPRAYHISNWNRMSDVQRVAFLRDVALRAGRDPRLREVAFRVLAGIRERDYPAQAAALLKAVQPGGMLGVAYRNESGEVLQDPLYTLQVHAGDCDDVALLLAALFESVRLPWRFVLSGSNPKSKQRARWIEGEGSPPWGIIWSHIYLVVGWPPFAPKTWAFAEPTVRGKPLGWDVIRAMEERGGQPMPELAGGTSMVSTGAGIAASSLTAATDGRSMLRAIALAVVAGTAVSVFSTYAIRWLEHREVLPPRKLP